MGKPVVLRFLAAGDKEVGEAFEKIGAKSEAMGEKLNKTGGKATAFAKKFTAALAIGVAAVAVVAIKRGDELNESQDQLAKALDNSGQSAVGVNKKLGPLQKMMEKFGFTNAQVDDSITAFTRSGVKLKDAIKDEAIAADLAKAKHIDLGTATMLVTKASQGQIKGLKALAIDLPVAAGGALKLKVANLALVVAEKNLKSAQDARAVAYAKGNALIARVNTLHLKGAALVKARSKAEQDAANLTDRADAKIVSASAKVKLAQGKVNDAASAGDKIMGALAHRMKGSAEESTKSLAGKTAALKAKFTDMTAHLGQKLIPIVLMLGTKLGALADFFTHNKVALVALLAVVGLFTAAMLTLTIIDTVKKLTEAWTKAQAALNFVMDANPIVLVGIAIVAIGAALFLAYKHFAPFHKAVDALWQILQSGFAWVKGHWPLLLAILTGPIGIAVYEIAGHWSAITNGAKNVVHDVTSFFGSLPGKIAGFASDIGHSAASVGGKIASGIVNGITGAAGTVKGFAKGLVNGLIGYVNRDVIDKIDAAIGAVHLSFFGHKVGLPSHVIPDIPMLANGALVSRPTLAMIGDDGAEMVLPLSRPARARQLVEQSGVMGGGGGSAPIVQHITALDVHEAMRVARAEQAWAAKTSGR